MVPGCGASDVLGGKEERAPRGHGGVEHACCLRWRHGQSLGGRQRVRCRHEHAPPARRIVGHVQVRPATSGERPLGSQHRRALSVAPSELGDRVAVAVEREGEPTSLVPRREQGLSATGGRSRRPRRDPDRDRVQRPQKRMRLDHRVRAGHDRLGLTLVAAVDRMGDLNFLEPSTIGRDVAADDAHELGVECLSGEG